MVEHNLTLFNPDGRPRDDITTRYRGELESLVRSLSAQPEALQELTARTLGRLQRNYGMVPSDEVLLLGQLRDPTLSYLKEAVPAVNMRGIGAIIEHAFDERRNALVSAHPHLVVPAPAVGLEETVLIQRAPVPQPPVTRSRWRTPFTVLAAAGVLTIGALAVHYFTRSPGSYTPQKTVATVSQSLQAQVTPPAVSPLAPAIPLPVSVPSPTPSLIPAPVQIAPAPSSTPSYQTIQPRQGDTFWGIAKHQLSVGGHKPKNADIVQYLNEQLLPLNGRKTLAECTIPKCPPTRVDATNPNRLLPGESVKIPLSVISPVSSPAINSTPLVRPASESSPAQSPVLQSPPVVKTGSLQRPLPAMQIATYAPASTLEYAVQPTHSSTVVKSPAKRYADASLLHQRLSSMVADYQQFLRATYDPNDLSNAHVAKADEQMLQKYSHLGSVSQLHATVKRAVNTFGFKLGQESLHLIDEEKLYQVQELDEKFKDDFRLDELLDGAQRILGVRIDATTYGRLVFRDMNKPIAKPVAVQLASGYQPMQKAA